MAAALRLPISQLAQRGGRILLPAVSTQFQPANGIKSKVIRDIEGLKRPPPFDYANKKYGIIASMFDSTLYRMDDNSKVIIVEGPIAAGKTEVAKKIAKDLDMHYVADANMDDYFVNEYGFDLRKLDHLLPEHARTFDTNDFLKNPKSINVAAYQLHMCKLKWSNYYQALAHLFNTGQGVVLDRSFYSDYVFVEAMYRAGYLSKNFHRAYYEVRENVIDFLLRPHLVIYLDVPVDVVQQNIKKRNLPVEVNSEVLKNVEYLKNIEHVYKYDYLKTISTHSELLVYDWSNGGEGEIDLVVDDIERIDFDRFEKHDRKLREWRQLFKDPDWNDARRLYTNDYHIINQNFHLPLFYCDELILSADDSKDREDVWAEAPGEVFAPGYNTDMGDTGILWKTGDRKPTNPKGKV